MTEVKNFIPVYPEEDDDLISNITKLQEFYDLKLRSSEEPSGEIGKPLSHQELQARFFSQYTPYQKCVLWHQVGTGKTCGASILVENFKNVLTDGLPRKKALILVKNNHLRESFRNEIATVCTKNVYFSRLRPEEQRQFESTGAFDISAETKRRRLNAEISKTYEIITYGDLLEKKKFPNDRVIEEDYSNRIIIVDEIHNIRVQAKEKDSQYNLLHRFLHVIKNCRIFLLTATPIWDKVYDIASLFNLLLPNNEQFPILDKFVKEYFRKGKLRNEKRNEFIEKVRGKISYIRASTSSAKKTEMGVKEPWLKWINIFPSAMSDFQSVWVDDAAGEFDDINDENSKSDAFLTNARDAANCIYPTFDKKGKIIGGVYGTKSFEKNAITKTFKTVMKGGESEKVRVDIFKFKSPELENAFRPVKNDHDIFRNLRKYSTKFATIISMLKDPERLQEKAFIYSDSVRGTGGVISFALILQLYGFKWIKNVNEIPKKRMEITEKSPGAFVVITSDDQTISEAAQIRKVMERYNRIDNVYGNFIRIIIGSQTISQGHTLKATRQGHIIMGHWNLPNIDQAMGRIYRTGSFSFLPEDERFVKFYRHCSVKKGDLYIKENGVDGEFSPDQSVDTHIYSIAEEKEYVNSQIYRIMKETAWDCALAYSRNVLENDQNGSRECDFVECNYKCYGTTPKKKKIYKYTVPESEVIHSNFNLIYSAEKVSEFISEIKNLFHIHFVLSMKDIVKYLNCSLHEIPILLNALNQTITKKIPIENRFGFISYLNQESNEYFLTESVTSSRYNLSTYIINPLISTRITLKDAIEKIELNKDMKSVCLFANDPTYQNFNKLSHYSQILLLEKTIEIEYTIGKKIDSMELIRSQLEKELFTMNDGNIVHNMYNARYFEDKYIVFAKDIIPNGKMRVFSIETKKWNYVDPEKEPEYIENVKNSKSENLKSRMDKIDNPYKIYAMYTDEGLKIIDNRKGKAASGVIWSSLNKDDLYNIFGHIKHLPYDDEIPASIKEKERKFLLSAFKANIKKTDKFPYTITEIEKMSDKNMKRAYTLLIMEKEKLRDSLVRWMSGENMEKRSYFI